VDVKTWLVDDILVKADRMSMAHSLELRSPLLDYRIAEFAASLPTDLKLNGLQKKFILKRSQTGILPYSIIHRKKRGFNAPVAHWLESGLQDLLLGAFKESPINDIINVGFVESLLEAHRQRTDDASFKLFNLLTLAFWMNSVGKVPVGKRGQGSAHPDPFTPSAPEPNVAQVARILKTRMASRTCQSHWPRRIAFTAL